MAVAGVLVVLAAIVANGRARCEQTRENEGKAFFVRFSLSFSSFLPRVYAP